jgi:hypothetical protein
MGFTGNRRIEPISTTSPGQETPPSPPFSFARGFTPRSSGGASTRGLIKKPDGGVSLPERNPVRTPGQIKQTMVTTQNVTPSGELVPPLPTRPGRVKRQGAGENAGRFASPDIGAEQGARQDARQGATRRQTKPLKGYQKYKRERGIKGYKKNPKAYLDYLKTKRKPDDRWKKAAFTSER